MLSRFIYLTLADDIGQLLNNKIDMVVTNAAERIESGLVRDLAVAQIFATRPLLLTKMEQGDVGGMNMHLQHLIDHMEQMDRVTIVNMQGMH